MQNNISSKPGVYIHIPFCEKKCVYCDFYSVTDSSSANSFINSLILELKTNSQFKKSDIFDTIYIGGGTPSLLSIDDLSSIITTVQSSFTVSDNAEVTIEVNPGTISGDDFKEYKKIGINRLSIGVQSFIDEELQFLGRIHNVKQVEEIISSARSADFDNLSIDLISSLPGQTIENWRYNLQKAAAIHPEHISAYTLIVEDGTPLHEKLLKGLITQKSSDEEAVFFYETSRILEKHGYLQYEISSFAKNEKYISRHNFKYWNHANYLGFGPSAHSFWNTRRFKNVSSLNGYIKKINNGDSVEAYSENLQADTLMFEYIFLRLGTWKGIDLNLFKKRFALDFLDFYAFIISDLIENKFAVKDNFSFRLTKKGFLLSDEILPYFKKEAVNAN